MDGHFVLPVRVNGLQPTAEERILACRAVALLRAATAVRRGRSSYDQGVQQMCERDLGSFSHQEKDRNWPESDHRGICDLVNDSAV